MGYSDMERYWIWLSCVEGIGVKRFYQLLTAFRDPREVWDNVGAPEMRFLGPKVLAALRTDRSEERMETLFKSLERAGCRAVTRLSDGYPAALGEIYDPPVTIYVRGECPLDSDRMLAVVGSRRATRDGRRAAAEIAAGLAREGVTVVAGVARGIDTAAHEGALTGGGRTIAVLGCGPDVVYPPENGELVDRILDTGGAIVSEYPPGTAPAAGHFPQRNRIISGMTPGVLLVEGAKGSGAMITVNQALDQGRDVFVVPGSIYSPLSAMPNRLLIEGARPALSAWEILEYYRWAERPQEASAPRRTAELDETEQAIVEPLRDQELSFEELRAQTGLTPAKLNSHLTMLELRGIIVKVPGGMYRAYPVESGRL